MNWEPNNIREHAMKTAGEQGNADEFRQRFQAPKVQYIQSTKEFVLRSTP